MHIIKQGAKTKFNCKILKRAHESSHSKQCLFLNLLIKQKEKMELILKVLWRALLLMIYLFNIIFNLFFRLN